MHTWVRRGLQTALVTGGLLMLGTGIASADENVNPDQPPSPVDGSVSVPINFDQNNIGTPAGQADTPSVQRTVSTDDLSGTAATGPAAPLTGPVATQAGPVLQDTGDQDLFRGNTVQAHLVAPIDICGNAIALGGDTTATGDCDQTVVEPHTVTTDGSGESLAGNVVGVNWALPVQIDGNAIGALGNAATHGTASQTALTGGDVTTSGANGTVAGTIVDGQWATPVQATNNAIAGGGNAFTDSVSESDGYSPGALATDGSNGTAAGTIGGAPIAVPLQANGNGISGVGNAHAKSTSTANSTGGTTSASNTGFNGWPTWALTNGDPSTASGNVAQPQVSGPVSLDDNAGTAVGNATANSTNNSTDSTGGITSTSGTGSAGSGNVANAPVALPTSGAGNAAAGIGNAGAQHTNNVTSTAGDTTFSPGDNSTLSSNTATVPPAGAVDVCGAAAGGAANTNGNCVNNVTSTSGNYTGTTGSGSTGSGNIVQTPVAAPVEGYGAAANAAGNGAASATETKSVKSGGNPNSNDDNGTLTSNVVATPVALPAQAFGDNASLVGNSSTMTDSNAKSIAGGDPSATGRNATGAGNIVQLPESVPAQVFGLTATGVGNGGTATKGTTDSEAGGKATSTGQGGAASGNIVSAPGGTATQAFGDAASGVGLVYSATSNTLTSKAGGDIGTNGDGGALSGDAVTAQAMPITQAFGNAVAAVANSNANATNDSVVKGGGDTSSSAQGGSLSGDVLAVPVLADPDAFANSVAAAGNANSTAVDNTAATNGGNTSTSGDGLLNGFDSNLPVEADVDPYELEVPIAGQANAVGEDNSVTSNGASPAEGGDVDLPTGGTATVGENVPSFGQLPFGELPGLPQPGGMQTMAAPAGLPALPALPALPVAPQLAKLPALAMLSQLPVTHPAQAAAGSMVARTPVANQAPVLSDVLRDSAAAPATPAQGVTGLVPGAQGVTGALPTQQLLGGLQGKAISGVLPVHRDLLPKI